MIIKGKNVAFEVHGELYHCAMDVTMEFIGGKWKAVVLWYLKSGTLRFSEIKKRIQKFKNELRELIEASGDYEEVYQLSVSYFPLSRDATLKENK